MAILNENDFIDVTETVEKLDMEGPNFNKKYFESGSSTRLVEYVNRSTNVQVTFTGCVFSNLIWIKQSIRGKVLFYRCLFKGGKTTFEQTEFRQDVSFEECVFADTVSFDNTVFKENVSFKGIHSMGNEHSAFLFRGDIIEQESRPAYNHTLNFSDAVFENNAVFNYRQFDKCTLFNRVAFKHYFFFADTALGHKTSFENVTFPCVEDWEHNPSLEQSNLIRCFENLIPCLEKANQRCFKTHVEQILKGLEEKMYNNWEQNDEDSLVRSENEFVSVKYIMSKTGWETRTLSSYASKFPHYFEMKGTGKSRTYRWSKIQEFLNAPVEEKRNHQRAPDPSKNKKKGCKYAA